MAGEQTCLRTGVVILGAGIAGMIGGYALGVSLLCSGANAGNLCGLPAAFIGAPGGGCYYPKWDHNPA